MRTGMWPEQDMVSSGMESGCISTCQNPPFMSSVMMQFVSGMPARTCSQWEKCELGLFRYLFRPRGSMQTHNPPVLFRGRTMWWHQSPDSWGEKHRLPPSCQVFVWVLARLELQLGKRHLNSELHCLWLQALWVAPWPWQTGEGQNRDHNGGEFQPWQLAGFQVLHINKHQN